MSKIIILIDHLASGGAQRQAVAQADLLAKAGNQVTLLTYSERPLAYELPAQVAHVPLIVQGSLFRNIRRVFAVRGVVQSLRANTVLALLDIPTVIGFLAARTSIGVRFVASKRAALSRKDTGFPMKVLWRFIYSNSHALITNSPVVAHDLARTFKVKRQKLYVVNNIAPRVPRMSGSHGKRMSDDGLEIACIGRVVSGKNPLDVARALLRVREQGVAARVHWFGEPIDDSVVNSVNSLFEQNNDGDAWVWRGVSTAVLDELSKFDVLVHASSNEGLPNAVIEGSISGCCCIVSNIEAHRYLAAMGLPLQFFEVGDVDAIAERLLDASHCLGPHREMRSIKQEVAERLFSGDIAMPPLCAALGLGGMTNGQFG